VILATNRPESIDTAVVRPGRIDRKIRISRPTRADAEHLFAHYLRGVALEAPSLQSFSRSCADQVFHVDLRLYRLSVTDASGRNPHEVEFTFADLVSGAMIEAIVQRAKYMCLRDYIFGMPLQLGLKHIHEAVDAAFAEERLQDHREAFREVADRLGIRITDSARVRSDGGDVAKQSE
jgi:proteasome-associated ATPase